MNPVWRRSGRSVGALIVTVAALTAATASMRYRPAGESPTAATAETLVASLRAEPQSFNRYTARDLSTAVLTLLMHDTLVRINRITNEVEPALAERWELLGDHRTYRLQLRRGVRFSDGAPFSADDVVFSFKAIYDPSVDSVLADSLQIRGEPLVVNAEDATTVTIRFPSPFGPGLRMLDGVPIYPRHRLEPSLKGGTFRSAWGLSSRPDELSGLGPFVLRRYVPGQWLTFDRNPHYWRRGDTSSPLAHMILQVVSDQDAELLQLESGGIDLTQSELRPSDVPALKRAVAAGRVAIAEAGVGLDGDLLWMNLSAGRARDPRARWLQHRDFRRAIAQSIDRQAFVDTVYLGAAVPSDSVVSPGNREWHIPAPLPDFDVAGAKRLLASLKLSPRNAGGVLQDEDGSDVRLTLLTQKGNTSLERGASMIRDSLARVGVHVDVVALEVGALIARVMRGDYDAAYFRILTTDSDPALNLDFWLSSGSAHIWNPGQRSASTAWEAQIDSLVMQLSTSQDHERRRAAFADVQRIMARELPVLCFAFPRLSVAVNSRVTGVNPAPFRPIVLWSPEQVGIRTLR